MHGTRTDLSECEPVFSITLLPGQSTVNLTYEDTNPICLCKGFFLKIVTMVDDVDGGADITFGYSELVGANLELDPQTQTTSPVRYPVRTYTQFVGVAQETCRAPSVIHVVDSQGDPYLVQKPVYIFIYPSDPVFYINGNMKHITYIQGSTGTKNITISGTVGAEFVPLAKNYSQVNMFPPTGSTWIPLEVFNGLIADVSSGFRLVWHAKDYEAWLAHYMSNGSLSEELLDHAERGVGYASIFTRIRDVFKRVLPKAIPFARALTQSYAPNLTPAVDATGKFLHEVGYAGPSTAYAALGSDPLDPFAGQRGPVAAKALTGACYASSYTGPFEDGGVIRMDDEIEQAINQAQLETSLPRVHSLLEGRFVPPRPQSPPPPRRGVSDGVGYASSLNTGSPPVLDDVVRMDDEIAAAMDTSQGSGVPQQDTRAIEASANPVNESRIEDDDIVRGIDLQMKYPFEARAAIPPLQRFRAYGFFPIVRPRENENVPFAVEPGIIEWAMVDRKSVTYYEAHQLYPKWLEPGGPGKPVRVFVPIWAFAIRLDPVFYATLRDDKDSREAFDCFIRNPRLRAFKAATKVDLSFHEDGSFNVLTSHCIYLTMQLPEGRGWKTIQGSSWFGALYSVLFSKDPTIIPEYTMYVNGLNTQWQMLGIGPVGSLGYKAVGVYYWNRALRDPGKPTTSVVIRAMRKLAVSPHPVQFTLCCLFFKGCLNDIISVFQADNPIENTTIGWASVAQNCMSFQAWAQDDYPGQPLICLLTQLDIEPLYQVRSLWARNRMSVLGMSGYKVKITMDSAGRPTLQYKGTAAEVRADTIKAAATDPTGGRIFKEALLQAIKGVINPINKPDTILALQAIEDKPDDFIAFVIDNPQDFPIGKDGLSPETVGGYANNPTSAPASFVNAARQIAVKFMRVVNNIPERSTYTVKQTFSSLNPETGKVEEREVTTQRKYREVNTAQPIQWQQIAQSDRASYFQPTAVPTGP